MKTPERLAYEREYYRKVRADASALVKQEKAQKQARERARAEKAAAELAKRQAIAQEIETIRWQA